MVWYAIVEWPLSDAPSSTHGVFTSLVYLSAVAYISVEISLGSCWCGDISRVKGQGFITNCNFLWLCVICNHRVVTTRCTTIWCANKYPWCSFSLSRYCCLHFCRNKFGVILAQGYFKGQRSSIIHKLQLFMTLSAWCDMQLLSGHYLMRHQVPMVSLLL